MSERARLAAIIDQTQLGFGVTRGEVEDFVRNAVEHEFGCVCVLPNMVAPARRIAASSGMKIATVVSFPLGADVPAVKRAAACAAVEQGADEIDMVIDVAAARAGDFDAVEQEVAVVREALAGGIVLKTIIEMPFLTPAQAVETALAAERGGATIVKTSTGFKGLGIRPTTAEDVRLLRSVLSRETGIKASGGVSSWTLAKAMLDAGATRIGTSSGVQILQQFSGQSPATAKGSS